MAVVSTAGSIEIGGSDQYEGGHIADLSLNVDIVNGATAQVKLVNEDGSYTNPALGTQTSDAVIIEIFSAEDSSVFSTDFLPIESNEVNGPGGKFLQVSFVEAGPTLVRKIPVGIRGRMSGPNATSGNMLINVGAKYFTSSAQDGALIRATDMSDSQKKKLEDSEFLKARGAEVGNIFLFTASELMDGIIACGVPYTENFFNFMKYGMEGQYFSNGGDLGSVLQEITQRAGNQWYWNGYGSSIPSVQATGVGTHGLDIFVSAADIAAVLEGMADDEVVVDPDDTVTTVIDDSQLLSSSTTRSLRGTNSMGASFALHVPSTHPANMERGEVKCGALAAADEDTKALDCEGEDAFITSSIYRADGSRKKPETVEDQQRILGYCRLINALRMGEEFFRMYVYVKMVGLQTDPPAPPDPLSGRDANTGYASAFKWLDKPPADVAEPEISRNLIIEELFGLCVNVAAPLRLSNDHNKNLAEENAVASVTPWSQAGLVSDIQNNLIGTSTEAEEFLRANTMVAYVEHRDPEEADNMLHPNSQSQTFDSLVNTLTEVLTEVYLIPGPRDVVCGAKVEKTQTNPANYVTFTWNVGTRFYAPFPVQETNPFGIAEEGDVFYDLARAKARKADWAAVESEPEFNGWNFATLVAFLRGDFANLKESWDNLNCPAQEKTAINAENDRDKDWACSTQHTELMPNGKIAWGTRGGLNKFEEDQIKQGQAWLKRMVVGTKQGDVKGIQQASAAGFTCILLPYWKTKFNSTPRDYFYEENQGSVKKPEYKTKPFKIKMAKAIERDLIDIFLDTLDGAFTPEDILNNYEGNSSSPSVIWESPGEALDLRASALASGVDDVLNVSNQNHQVQLEDVLKESPGKGDNWRQGIAKIKCDGTEVKGGFASLISSGTNPLNKPIGGGKIKPGNGLTNKKNIMQLNLLDMAQSSTTFDASVSEGGSFVYAGVPALPTIWEGLQGLSISVNAQGITTTVNIGKIKIQGSRFQRYQQGNLRDFVVSEGFDSTAQFFGTEFKNRTQQTIPSYSIKIDKPNQANIGGTPPLQPPPK